MTDKDSDVRLMSHFLWEVSELDATTRRADVSALKAFITKQTVTVRKPYGRHDTIKPALASLFGTVNETTGFLTDESGNRRFLVTSITAIDWNYTALDVNQLWAQAVALYHAGEPWRLQPCELARQQETNKAHEVESVLDGWIVKYFDLAADPKARMTAADIMLALQTGRRRAELADLRMGDIEITGHRITVTWRRCKGGKIMLDTLPNALQPPLMDYLAAVYGPSFTDLPPESPVWVRMRSIHKDIEPISASAISHICEHRLGTSNVHRLRHTFAKAMEQVGAKLSDIQASRSQ